RRCGVVKVASKTEDDNRTEKCHPLQWRRSVNVSDNTPASHRCSLSSISGSGVRCLIRQCKHKNGVSGRRKGTVRHQVSWNLVNLRSGTSADWNRDVLFASCCVCDREPLHRGGKTRF